MISAIIGPHDIKKGVQQMLRGVTIDKKVILKNDDLCLKAFQKRSLLRQELCWWDLLYCESFIINSPFCYLPLIWESYSNKLNNKINTIHKRLLQLVCNDNKNSFEELLPMNKSAIIK